MSPPYYSDESVTLWHGDSLAVLREMPDSSVNCCVTSPPYFGLRDYGEEGQYGLESSPAEYVETVRAVFAEVRRVLADDGTLWLNIGDSYSGSGKGAWGTSSQVGHARVKTKERFIPTREQMPTAGKSWEGLPPKNLMGIPWRTAFALQDDGWILRNAIVWHKPNAMPSSVKDRLNNSHELVFLFSKSPRYWFDLDAIKIPTTGQIPGNTKTSQERYGSTIKAGERDGRRFGGNASSTLLELHETRNPGDVWSLTTHPFPDAHFAVMPQSLAARAILAGCKPDGTVLDPFSGSGTTGLAAAKHGRKYVGIDLNADYLDLSLKTRLAQPGINFDGAAS